MRFIVAPPAARYARAAFSAEMRGLAGEGAKSARFAPHGNGGNQACTGAYERFKLTRAGMDRFGVTPFLLAKAVAMGAFGAATTLSAWAVWIWGPLAVWYAGWLLNNAIVLRRLKR